jgi:hypothetical protein
LLTNAVQTLAGVLLPSATVFLLLLCNDKAVLGPWVNTRWLNLFTGAVIAVLVMLSMILTLAVLFPGITEAQIIWILIGGSIVAAVTAIGVTIAKRLPVPGEATESAPSLAMTIDETDRYLWHMPPLHELPPAQLTVLNRVWLIVLRAYLVVAAGLVLVRIVMLAMSQT